MLSVGKGRLDQLSKLETLDNRYLQSSGIPKLGSTCPALLLKNKKIKQCCLLAKAELAEEGGTQA